MAGRRWGLELGGGGLGGWVRMEEVRGARLRRGDMAGGLVVFRWL